MSDNEDAPNLPDLEAGIDELLGDLTADTPLQGPEMAPQDPNQYIVVTAFPDGTYGVNIDYRISPIVVAGAAWYLEQMAQMALANQLQRQAIAEREAAEEAEKHSGLVVPMLGHLGKKGAKRN